METLVVNANIHIVDDILHDLTKRQRHDSQIVTTQTQNGDTNDKAHHTSHNAAADHCQNQAANIAGNSALKQSCHDDAGECTDAHKARMAQAQLTADTNQQVQRNCQNNVSTDGNQIATNGVGQHTTHGQSLHDHKCHNHNQISDQVGAAVFVIP